MARPMNLEKRIKALTLIVTRSKAQKLRVDKIAKELATRFKDKKTPEGQRARKAAKAAALLAGRLALVSKNVSL